MKVELVDRNDDFGVRGPEKKYKKSYALYM